MWPKLCGEVVLVFLVEFLRDGVPHGEGEVWEFPVWVAAAHQHAVVDGHGEVVRTPGPCNCREQVW